MPFNALPPVPASPVGAIIAGDDFWPGIDANAMRDELRIGPIVTHARLAAAIKGGLISIDRELADWRAAREREGAAELAQVEPDRKLADTHRLSLLFTRAVQFAAAAELAELHRDISATQEGATRAESEVLTARDYRRLALEAVRDMLNVNRCAIELL